MPYYCDRRCSLAGRTKNSLSRTITSVVEMRGCPDDHQRGSAFPAVASTIGLFETPPNLNFPSGAFVLAGGELFTDSFSSSEHHQNLASAEASWSMTKEMQGEPEVAVSRVLHEENGDDVWYGPDDTNGPHHRHSLWDRVRRMFGFSPHDDHEGKGKGKGEEKGKGKGKGPHHPDFDGKGKGKGWFPSEPEDEKTDYESLIAGNPMLQAMESTVGGGHICKPCYIKTFKAVMKFAVMGAVKMCKTTQCPFLQKWCGWAQDHKKVWNLLVAAQGR